jgi:NhaA family Na+:H+ antiporter
MTTDKPHAAASRLRRSLTTFEEFLHIEAAGGALLLACAVVAMIVANSPWADWYHATLATPVAISSGGHTQSLTAGAWINDALMAIFFLLVGLEIKREVLVGELSSPRNAALPLVAAVGGMVVPALIYFLVNPSGLAAHGWATPMATDIAFALGILAMAAPRAPSGLKIFLAALAIVDDLGAVLVIAVFYSDHVEWGALGKAGVVLALLACLNLARVRYLTAYLALGVLLWFFVHESGVHATIAGVLLAFCIPTRTKINATDFSREARRHLDEFDRTESGDLHVLTSKGQQAAIAGIAHASDLVTPPLLHLEHALHRFSAFVVMPMFALANAGVTLTGVSMGRVTAGVVLGLVVGKLTGILGASALAVRLRIASLPQGVTWNALHGCAWLGGIGFTMSLFIASLAFKDSPLLDGAKVGILVGSLVAGIVGTVILRRAGRSPAPALQDARSPE